MQAPAFDLAVVDGSLGSYNVWAGSRGSGGGVERRGRGARGVWGGEGGGRERLPRRGSHRRLVAARYYVVLEISA